MATLPDAPRKAIGCHTETLPDIGTQKKKKSHSHSFEVNSVGVGLSFMNHRKEREKKKKKRKLKYNAYLRRGHTFLSLSLGP